MLIRKAEVAQLAKETWRQKMVIDEIECQEQDKLHIVNLNVMGSVEKGKVAIKKQLTVLRENLMIGRPICRQLLLCIQYSVRYHHIQRK